MFPDLGMIRPAAALAVHVVIATAVTIHVLLTKREVGAALGWIGLAWLSPVAGGAIYLILGINRVKRRARRLQVPHAPPAGDVIAHVEGALAPLEHAIGRITGRPALSGNAIAIYQNGDEAYPAMIAAIGEARESIGLSSYIFEDDETGRRFIQALAAACRRGADVRVIIDGVGGGYLTSRAYHALQRADIPAGRFMHSTVPWRMPLLNLRSHKKILVIDGRTGFTGGMNIADDNVMALRSKHPVQDTHFKITGPVVAQLTSAFTRDWSFVTNQDLTGPAWFPHLEPAGDAHARVITSCPDADIEKIEYTVLQTIACAAKTILIMTPYFLPDEQIVTALTLAVMRGVSVDLVIPRQSNQRFVDWATRPTVAPMLRQGVKVWLGPPPFRHSKVMIIDGAWSLIGSNNWDIRSFRLNFELSMEVYDRALAGALTAFVMAHKGSPLTAKDLDALPPLIRLRDASVRLMMPYL
jgi:cardiolipin synthase